MKDIATDDVVRSLAAERGRKIKDIELFNKEFFMTVIGTELKLMHRNYLGGLHG